MATLGGRKRKSWNVCDKILPKYLLETIDGSWKGEKFTFKRQTRSDRIVLQFDASRNGQFTTP